MVMLEKAAKLCQLERHELALYLRGVSTRHGAKPVAEELLASIEQDALPPTTFGIFASSCSPPCPLKDALWQPCSKHVRRVAIMRFGKDMRSTAWKDRWEEVGGTEGLLSLFARLSVIEVKELSKAVGCCKGRSEDPGEERQQRITELLKGLLPEIYPDARYQISDQRPLHRYYAHMVPACTSDFVETLLCRRSHPLLEALPNKYIVQHHFQRLIRLVLETLLHRDMVPPRVSEDIANAYLPLLLNSVQQKLGAEPGFSASMTFAAVVLQHLANRKHVHFPARPFLPELMNPLMRRLESRKIESNRVRQIIDLAVRYLQKSDGARDRLSFDKGSLISNVASFWSQDTIVFEDPLTTLIRMERQTIKIDLASYDWILQLVKQPLRYRLLRMICVHGPDGRLDIDTVEGLQVIPVMVWPVSVFYQLQYQEALQLLRRLLRVYPEGKFLALPWKVSFMQVTALDSRFPNANVLLTQLQDGDEGGEVKAQADIEELKAKAVRSRDQPDRASFAMTVLFHAIASGSLHVFKDAVLWIRRFQRDPLTLATLYTNEVWNTEECIALLGGIPRNLKSRDASSVRDRIMQANSILMDLLESAVMSLREPSFLSANWKRPRSLFREVVKHRIHQAGRLKERLQLSDDEVHTTLWAETLKMLLEAEEIGLQHEHRILGFNRPYGPAACFFTTEGVKPPLSSSYRFLDDLARSRDKLWQAVRQGLDPAVAALDPPWPKGLPIQCLTGSYKVATERACGHMPFVASRAADVTILEPSQALKLDIDEDIKCAVGSYVDSYDYALEIYVMQSPPGQEREARLSTATSHAINRLRREDVTEDEAQAFWKPVFRRVLPDAELPGLESDCSETYPMIPPDTDPLQPTEWNPDPSVTIKVPSRKLKTTALDCMLEVGQYSLWYSGCDFPCPEPQIDAVESTPIWSHELLAKACTASPSSQEGLILAALLVQASKIEGASSVLSSPFPPENVRYPALFLDEGFLRSADDLRPSPVEVLSRLTHIVPSTLLSSLTHTALSTLFRTPPDSKKMIAVERTAFGMLRLLLKSDRPQLALEPVVRAIFNCPDASSWHRQLLTKRWARSLAASEAKILLESFASSVNDKLRMQASRPKPKASADEAITSSKPLIKVTTVKMLAQFLDDADFLSPLSTVDVLRELFESAAHIDIRVAVVDTLIGKIAHITDGSSNDFVDHVIKALKSTILVIGSLNERNSDPAWGEAQKTGRLPEVYIDGDNLNPPPILNAVFRAVSHNHIKSKLLRQRLIDINLLPAIEYSISENGRWIRAFILKHSPGDSSFNPPVLPPKPVILGSLIRQFYSEGLISETLLHLYHQGVMFNLSPPPGLSALNRKINADASLRDSNEGQHWLSLYGPDGHGTKVDYIIMPKILIQKWLPSFDTDGTRLAHAQDLVRQEALKLLELEELSFTNWNRFMAVLEPPLNADEDVQNTWIANAKTVVQRIIEGVESLRTDRWQRSRDRKPAMLPDMYDMQLWMWPYPQLNRRKYSPPRSPTQQERCIPFATKVSLALCGPHGIVNNGFAEYGKLKSIESAVLRCSTSDRLYIAWRVGAFPFSGDYVEDDPEESIGDVDELLIRSELASTVFEKSKLPALGEDKGSATVERNVFRGRASVVDLLERWKMCEIEEVRMRGFRLWEHFGL